ncbi:hypothetical protein GCM10023205_48580 [Yinghuangia aomiensis]|uniref:Uncharacterized protein n=1 Tax=Yinghuangia aomiensis TaxID=676205 RepID=A0ABP9HQL4_9ACTN
MADGGEGMRFFGHDWNDDREMTVVPWDGDFDVHGDGDGA